MSVDTATDPDPRAADELLGFDVTVRRVIVETHDAMSIELDATPRLDYQPGQFLTLRIPVDTAEHPAVSRSYSLSSCPELDTHPKITVKRVDGGVGSNWLCDHLGAGSTLRILPPAGGFKTDPTASSHLFFAAGSGITPVISMLKSVLGSTSTPVFVLYANRGRKSVIFHDELDALAARHPEQLTLTHWLDDERGLISPDELRTMIPPSGTQETAYVCGPEMFTTSVVQALSMSGFDPSRIRREEFVSIAGDPFALSAPTGDPDTAATTSLVVDLDGEVTSIECGPKTPLLDAMLAAGMDPPYSCREGTCGSCMALLHEGEVEHGCSLALAPDDAEDGYILPCQALARSAVVSVEF